MQPDAKPANIKDLQAAPFFANAFARVCRISDFIAKLDYSSAEISRLFEMIRDYSFEINSADMSSTQSRKECVTRFTAILGDIEHFVQSYGESHAFLKIAKRSEHAISIESYFLQLARACEDANIPIHSRAYYEQGLIALRQKDKEDLDLLLENVLEDPTESKIFSFVKGNHTNELDALDQIRHVIMHADATTRVYLNRIMAILVCRVEKVCPLQPWAIRNKHIALSDHLGDGLMGSVYKGDWNGKVVAVKILDISVPMTVFEEQAQQWSQLHHPNVLEMLGASQYEAPCLFVLPYCTHGNVNVYLRNNPSADRLQLIRDITCGLDYLHSNNVCHHELKGDNVMVDEHFRAVITDFGVALIKNACTGTTEESAFEPNPRWLSPERLSRGISTKESDIYCLGVTMWEVITSKSPWTGHNLNGARRAIMMGGMLEIPDLPFISHDMKILIQQCWSIEPSARPTSSQVAEFFRSYNTPITVQSSSTAVAPPSGLNDEDGEAQTVDGA